MDPRELNLIVSGIANFLYTELSEKDFIFVKILLSELTKSMFSLELLRNITAVERVENDIKKALEEPKKSGDSEKQKDDKGDSEDSNNSEEDENEEQ